MMKGEDFKKILPGNPDLHGVLFDETQSDDEVEEQEASQSPDRTGTFNSVAENSTTKELDSIME